ncbi:MAG: hypothetical protein WA880_04315 [Ornithinimicrobium sp.]
MLTEASEYRGQAAIRVACTQLDGKYSKSQTKRVVEQWVELLAGTTTPLTDVQFVTRTPSGCSPRWKVNPSCNVWW